MIIVTLILFTVGFDGYVLGESSNNTTEKNKTPSEINTELNNTNCLPMAELTNWLNDKNLNTTELINHLRKHVGLSTEPEVSTTGKLNPTTQSSTPKGTLAAQTNITSINNNHISSSVSIF